MNFNYLKVITGRRFPIEYVAPPVCEGEFSSTGSPFISLLPILKESIETLEATYQDGVFKFSWDHVDGALCYSVWKLQETDEWEIVAECIPTPEWETNQTGCYKVTVISEEGMSSLDDAPTKCTNTAFQCAVFSTSLPAAVNAEEGVDVVFTATAATTPAANLNYVWKKDGAIILSEVLPSGTPSVVTKTGVVPADSGTYRVEVTVTDHEECDPIASECVLDVEPAVVPASCDDILDPMPESFLEDDFTLIGQFVGTIDGTYESIPGGLPGGVYRISYDEGSFVQCLKTVTEFYDCEEANRYRSERYVGGVLKINGNVVASFGGMDTANESGTCPACDPVNACENTPSTADAIANSTTFHGAGPGVTLDTTDVIPHTWTSHTAEVNCSYAVIPPDACNYEIDLKVSLYRTKKYTPQPESLQVVSWETVWAAIKPAGAIDQSWPYGDPWQGFIELPGISDLAIQYYLGFLSYPVVDFVDIAGSVVFANAGDKWYLQFWGYWFDGEGEHSEILWEGHKLGGEDARGGYTRVQSWNVSTPECVVLE